MDVNNQVSNLDVEQTEVKLPVDLLDTKFQKTQLTNLKSSELDESKSSVELKDLPLLLDEKKSSKLDL